MTGKEEHKHLGMILDSKLDFRSHTKEAIVRARRGIGMIRYLSKYVSRDVLDQIYKLYVRPHLDYGDIIYHRDDTQMQLNFTQRLEQTQYSAALAVTGAWRGTSRQRLYDELGWETLYHRRWYRRLCHFFKLIRSHSPEYKLFADDTSLFTVVQEPNTAAEDINHDLELISKWAHDWRMSFNPDPQKQAVELLLSKKRHEIDHPVILFNNIPVKKVSEHKHLGVILDSKLSFSAHIKSAISKTRKGIGLLRHLSKYLPRHTLNEYKLFADDTSLFTVVQEPNTAAEDMNHDLELISKWAHDWRMSFNPDPQKQAVELLLSKKRHEIDHPVILFNNIPVKKVSEHKHLGVILDSKLSFSAHIKSAISKTRKGIGLLRHLSKYLPRHTLNELYNYIIND